MPEPTQLFRLSTVEKDVENLNWDSLKSNGGDGTSDGMESRIAKLEAHVENIKETLRDIKTDIRDLRSELGALRSKVDSHFMILGGMVIATAVGLAGMMAKGFHWIGG